MQASTPSVSIGRLAIWTATILIVAGLLLALYSLRDLLLMFFVAIVVSAAMRPLVLGLQRYGLPRPVAAIIVYLSILAVIIGVLVFTIPPLIGQVASLVEQAPTRYAELLDVLRNSSSRTVQALAANLPNLDNLSEVQGRLGSMMNEASVLSALNAVRGIAEAFVTVFLVAFYWTLDQSRMERLWLSLAPPSERPRLLTIWREMEHKMGSYLRGTGILAVIMAVITSIGYVALGVPYALVLAVVAGLGEFVPVIGFLVGSLPATLIALTVSPQLALFVLGLNIVAQQFENYVLAPRIMSDAVGVSPVVIIFALLAFSALFGIVGAFLAIPLAAIIQVLLDRLILKTEPVEETVPEAGPLVAARSQLHALRGRLRERLRSREEALDVDSGMDALDQRIEDVVLTVDRAIAQASQDARTVEPEVLQTIQQAIQQVEQLAAESLDASSPVGLTPEASADEEAAAEVETVIQEAKQTLQTTAAQVREIAAEGQEFPEPRPIAARA
ncbi:MAG: AI-2E family transporter [Anaerolineae bacterium]|nr:AI-2E family transporter [Anaerolineae bacterium]